MILHAFIQEPYYHVYKKIQKKVCEHVCAWIIMQALHRPINRRPSLLQAVRGEIMFVAAKYDIL